MIFALFLVISGCAFEPKRLSGLFGVEESQSMEERVPETAPSISNTQPSREDLALQESKKGELAYRRESYKTAELHFRSALRMMPKSLHALSGLGWTLYDSGRPDEAYPVFERAHALFPEDGSVRRGLAYLSYRYGNTEKARNLLGSLDKERWPELTNIDDELRSRASRGLPPPRPLPKSLKSIVPNIIKEVFQPEPEKKKVNEEEKSTSREPALNASLPPKVSKEEENSGKSSFHGMVLIPGGVIGGRNTGKKRVKSFRIDKFEVTNAGYRGFVRDTKGVEPPYWKISRFSGPHLPVVGVTWEEARRYCQWAGKRLPTEDEWELAARGNDNRRRYPWGNKFEERNVVYALRPDRGGPKAVGRRPGGASVHGVEDLSGNVWEWVEDEFLSDTRNSRPVVRDGVVLRTLRGGSWVNGKWAMAVGSRTGDLPERRLPVYGFRCAADVP